MTSPKKENKPRRPLGRNVGPLVETETDVLVCYRDTDQMGCVYYANYLVYFEMARTDFLRQLGYSYRSCEKSGIFLPASEATCKYHAPARYDDLLRVHTRVVRWTVAAIDFEYECRRVEDNELIVTGSTRHVFTDKEGRINRTGGKFVAEQLTKWDK